MALKEAMDGPVVDTNETSAYAPLELFGALLESQKSILVEFRNSLLVMPEVTFFLLYLRSYLKLKQIIRISICFRLLIS